MRNTIPTNVTVPGSRARVAYAQLTGWRRRRPEITVPIHRPTRAEFAQLPDSGLRLTWFGHASVLAEVQGRRVLFDPVWSRRCSPFSFAGPGRCFPVPLPLRDLPEVDVIAISHDHYDHLDLRTVRELHTSSGAIFAVPLGIGAHLERWGVSTSRIVELDWHETARIAGLDITATPARHYCSRGPRRSATTLWCSWVVTGSRIRVFHCGDSGYFPGLAEIGSVYGPFDATMIPVGAYHDLWPDVHLTPEQAVRAHRDVQGGAFLPIHWGTYTLAPHPWAEPIERTLAAARATGTRLHTPRPGQPVELSRTSPPTVDLWWRPEHSRWTEWEPPLDASGATLARDAVRESSLPGRVAGRSNS